MREIFQIFCLTTLLFHSSIAQEPVRKPKITSSVYRTWHDLYTPQISSDGRFATFGSTDNKVSIVDLNSSWRKDILDGSQLVLSEDSRFAFYMIKDRLYILNLNTKTEKFIQNIRSFSVSNGSRPILGYQLDDDRKRLVLQDINSTWSKSFDNVVRWEFSQTGNLCFLIRTNAESQELLLFDLKHNVYKEIWSGRELNRFILSEDEKILAFLGSKQSKVKSIWTFSLASGLLKPMARAEEYAISENFYFDKSASKLFFQYLPIIKEPDKSEEKAPVDIWSYKDWTLQSLQLANIRDGRRKVYTSVVNLSNGNVTKLDANDREEILQVGKLDRFVLIRDPVDNGENFWKPEAEPQISLVSTVTGKRELTIKGIGSFIAPNGTITISPGGKFVVFFDAIRAGYYSLDTKSGKELLISSGIPFALNGRLNTKDETYGGGAIGGWLPDDKAILVYDRFDIWKLDPKGIKPPVCLTGGIGRQYNISFRFAREIQDVSLTYLNPIKELILTAQNRKNMDNGFFSIVLDKPNSLKELCMMPVTTSDQGLGPLLLKKAKKANVYVARMMSAGDYPNIVSSRDLKTFYKVTDYQPQRQYNWLSSELISWKTYNGIETKAILYKPEDFDPSKKYPVVFIYYNYRSQELNTFLKPDWVASTIDIPTYVSNGYLICVPDIVYSEGGAGLRAYNTLASGADFLSKLPYVDSSRLGLNGHSFGGYETNSVVTLTDKFAAAISSAGFSNMSTWGFVPKPSGIPWTNERGQQYIPGTLWSNREGYLQNSPVFNADKVTTPILMMNNLDDETVLFDQGVNFFVALRRLGKPSWLLQYDGERHQVGGRAAIDFTKRCKQFFDYYLMNEKPAQWMTRGRDASLKQVDDRFETETTNMKP